MFIITSDALLSIVLALLLPGIIDMEAAIYNYIAVVIRSILAFSSRSGKPCFPSIPSDLQCLI